MSPEEIRETWKEIRETWKEIRETWKEIRETWEEIRESSTVKTVCFIQMIAKGLDGLGAIAVFMVKQKGEMMDDLISRQAAIDVINHELRCGAVIDQCGLETAHDLIEELQPKTGRWIKVNGNTLINCSACYHSRWSLSFEDTVKGFNFCPNCGAKMENDT